MKYRNILILGDGGWGTALSVMLQRHGCGVTLWSAFPDYAAEVSRTRENRKFLPGVKLHDSIKITGDIAEAGPGVELIFSVVPTVYLRKTLNSLRDRLPKVPVVSGTKGIENETLLRPSEMIREILSPTRLAVISGPCHAEEAARGLPASYVVASEDEKYAIEVQQLLNTERFRVYTNRDVVGVELGGALKNIMAIAAGMCDGLRFGDSAKAALVSRGLVEMARLGVALGGKRETFSGLAGLGDLLVTCYSAYSRNRRVGEKVAMGATLQQVLDETEMKPEGVWTVKSALALAKKHRIEMPITEQVHAVLFDGRAPLDGVRELMLRPMKSEHDEGVVIV
jgi:glycerol-3-phosphate dehydrogenase (NAD(P)+)